MAIIFMGHRMKNSLKSLVLAFTLLVAASGVSFTQDFQKGLDAHKKGDYATALREFSLLSERGNADAQAFLGIMYDWGQGVGQNHKEAAMWFRKSAEQGDALGQFKLGFMYDLGQGVVQDYKEAAKWYRKSAEQGNANAHKNLASIYFLGLGVIRDEVYAHMWVIIAASQGSKGGIKLRDAMAKQMTASDISKAQELARECIRKKYKGC
jgi:TPR repeat protein